jgi:4-hydroxy-3-methylbut-2-enyl diphosphate reductase IspH
VQVDSVLLAAPRGFCAGVEMAIKALAWMVRAFEPPVYCYHEIVHNQLVVDRFRQLGVVFVDDISRGAGRAPRDALGPRERARRWSRPPGPPAATWSTPSARS